MSSVPSLPMAELTELERLRQRPALVWCAAELNGRTIHPNDVPAMYECLRQIGPVDRLDVVLKTEGGSIVAARRLALLLRDYAQHLSILLPFKALSAGTLLSLAANELVLGPLAELSPLDPIIRADRKSQPGSPDAISAEDIRAFCAMGEKWFGLNKPEHRLKMFSLLAERFFPTSLSSFYRADRYVRIVADELLQYQLPRSSAAQRRRVIERLITGYPEHQHGFTRAEIPKLGLKAQAASLAEGEQLYKIWRGCADFMDASRRGADEMRSSVNAVIFSRGLALGYVSRWQARVDPPTEAPKPAQSMMESSARWERLSL